MTRKLTPHNAPTGVRILPSNTAVMKWKLTIIYFTSAFIQTGAAKRDVYVVLPRECRRKSFLLATVNIFIWPS